METNGYKKMSEFKEDFKDFCDVFGFEIPLSKFKNVIDEATKEAKNEAKKNNAWEISDLDISEKIAEKLIYYFYYEDAIDYTLLDDDYEIDLDLANEVISLLSDYSKTKEGSKKINMDGVNAINDAKKKKIINKAVKNFIDDPILGYVKGYNDDRLKIDKMKEITKSFDEEYVSEDDIIISLQYVEALKQINESRSFFWKMFHPFKNYAEKNTAKQIEERVTAYVQAQENGEDIEWYKNAARNYSVLQNGYNEFFEEMKDHSISDDSSILDDSLIEEHNEVRENIIVDDVNEVSEILENKNEEISNDDLFKERFVQ